MDLIFDTCRGKACKREGRRVRTEEVMEVGSIQPNTGMREDEELTNHITCFIERYFSLFQMLLEKVEGTIPRLLDSPQHPRSDEECNNTIVLLVKQNVMRHPSTLWGWRGGASAICLCLLDNLFQIFIYLLFSLLHISIFIAHI